MRSKVPVTVTVKTENLSSEGQRGLIEGDFVLPEVSSKDKKGGKLTKTMKPLLDKAIESALQLEKYLPREFTINNMVENQAASKRVQSKMTAIEREMKRHKDADTVMFRKVCQKIKIIKNKFSNILQTERNNVLLVRSALSTFQCFAKF